MERPPASPTKGHSRSRSATLLKSIISPSKSSSPKKQSEDRSRSPSKSQSSSTESRALGEIGGNSPSKSPKKKTSRKQKADIEPWTEADTPLSPAESLMLSPQHSFAPKDKENTTPPRSRNEEPYTPIWAEFSRLPLKDLSRLPSFDDNASRSTNQSQDQLQPASASPQKERKQSGYFPPVLAPPANITSDGQSPTSKGSPIKSSRIQQAVAKFSGAATGAGAKQQESVLEGKELDDAYERVLAARNIPENRRAQMRGLDAKIKRDFIKNDDKVNSALDRASSDDGTRALENNTKGRSKRGRDERARSGDYSHEKGAQSGAEEEPGSPSKRKPRSRSRGFTFSKGDRSKKSRSMSRPRSLMSLKNLSSSSVNSIGMDSTNESKEGSRRVEPREYVQTIQSAGTPQKVEVGRIQKLRRLLRHESVSWVDDFIVEGGMDALVGLLRKIMQVEWREEHEDMLLHETLLCLKGLCTTERALAKLDELQEPLFPELLQMLFDEERRGPSEYGTRINVTLLLFTHLSSAPSGELLGRAKALLGYLAGPAEPSDKKPADFISRMSKPRPYSRWCKEVSTVTKEVFWIFLHHLNMVPVSALDISARDESYVSKHFPRERPPVPAAPYIGGVEWEATNYLASHLDLMNGLIASMPTRRDRNTLREELRSSGFERVMGATLRLCKEKFYGAVHDGLRTWVDAAAEDGWETVDVRTGPPRSPQKTTPSSPTKTEAPPKLELPLAFGNKGSGVDKNNADDGWQL